MPIQKIVYLVGEEFGVEQPGSTRTAYVLSSSLDSGQKTMLLSFFIPRKLAPAAALSLR
jgi:hypothetical protein